METRKNPNLHAGEKPLTITSYALISEYAHSLAITASCRLYGVDRDPELIIQREREALRLTYYITCSRDLMQVPLHTARYM